MTRISLNKIPYKGPKTHNQILKQIRTDLAKHDRRISVEKIAIIVSSFFSSKVLFKDIPLNIKFYSSYIGSFHPARKKPKRNRINNIQKIKYRNAKKYAEDWERKRCYAIKMAMIARYNRWAIKREKKKELEYMSLEEYMKEFNLEFPQVRKLKRKEIMGSLWRFDDTGRLIATSNSTLMKRHFAQRDAKLKAEKALQNPQ